MPNLVHLLDESVDVLLSVAKVTALDVVVEFTGTETAVGVGQLEWPQEVAGLLEVGSNSEDLVDQVLHAHDAILAQVILDELVVRESNALLVDLSISTLVDKLADSLEVGVAIRDVWVDNCEHFLGGLGQLDENTVVDLQKTEELEDLAGLGSNLVDTGFELVSSSKKVERVQDPYPLILTTKTSLGCSSTKKLPCCLLTRASLIFSRSASRYSLT